MYDKNISNTVKYDVYRVADKSLARPGMKQAIATAPSAPFKTILELVLWNGLQSCRCVTPDVFKMPSFQYFLYRREQKKVTGV
jgi:hypothetical protein